ncbi:MULTISPECIES: hydantoinase/carbamoylase family amidase [unclassified Tatumella]|uniref:hydantoinase/carbamoylase family amidase n=1 Tax=unclassified Tatumella TaxID=2649542 RepID=UPI001BB0705A|nr:MULTISPECIES: hydantoinase/carbamoylase family amidase [unclassified Tatumella]MBS0878169.1 hydantoinase/carbamoylase family amidase [Tatumella sp. JGM82]MBS0892286.1 hydantoinase/carbamoylase family amidase [Tatumella sp. JGM94]MBS0902882.1 hydantoinase/carbamoylase family amidase [Tatumella sp. JGM100]
MSDHISDIELDGALMLEQILQLGSIDAAHVKKGRTRATLTDSDNQRRDRLIWWMRELNLDIKIGKVGNIFGTLPATDGLQEVLDTVGIDGTRLGDELIRIGYDGEMEPGGIEPHEYIEPHIEQGPILEAEGIQTGAVENLQGISWQEIEVTGTANHAGKTPTHLRHDAGYAAASVITYLRNLAKESKTLSTVGSLQIEPNTMNAIPGKARFKVDLRNPDEAQLKLAENQLSAFLSSFKETEDVEITTKQLVRFQPVTFAADIVKQGKSLAARMKFSCRRITSGAGHDVQVIARTAPSAMIFVPGKNGISHNTAEFTSETGLIHGASLLRDVVQQCLK